MLHLSVRGIKMRGNERRAGGCLRNFVQCCLDRFECTAHIFTYFSCLWESKIVSRWPNLIETLKPKNVRILSLQQEIYVVKQLASWLEYRTKDQVNRGLKMWKSCGIFSPSFFHNLKGGSVGFIQRFVKFKKLVLGIVFRYILKWGMVLLKIHWFTACLA